MWPGILLVPFLVIFLHWLYKECRRPPNFPPGPPWLPIIGNLHLVYCLKKKLGYLFSVLENLSEKYGPVYSLKLGQDLTVVITDYEIMKIMLTKEEFQGRPNGFAFTLATFGEKLGIILGDGPECASLRSFTMKALKDFGAGKEEMHQCIAEEASELVKFLKDHYVDNSKKMEQKFKLDRLFKWSILNSQWILIAGKRFDYDDDEFIHILDLATKFLGNFNGAGGIVNHLPWIRFIAPEASGFTALNNSIKPGHDYFQKIIDEHKSIFDENSKPTNYVDLFLAEIRKQKELSKTFNGTTFKFFSIKMSHCRMVLMRAFYMEILRHATLSPIGIARRAMEDTTLLQYQIPKDTVLVPVLHQVLMDEKYWGDPKEFRPERFLSADKSEFRPDDRLNITFGLGKRRCPGDFIASSTTFLFTASILQSFTLVPDENGGKLEWNEGITLSPPPFTGSIRARD